MSTTSAAALLLLTLAGTKPAATAPEPAEVFAGCDAPQDGPDGWVVPCLGMVAGLGDGPGDGACRTEACLQELVQGFARVAGAIGKPKESTITLAGSPRRLIQLDGIAEGRAVRVLMATVDRPEGRRVLNCFAAPSADVRCRAAFEHFAGLAWRPAPPAYLSAPAPRAFAGRPYREPPGCRGEIGSTAGAVQCDDQSTCIWEETVDASATEAKLARPFMAAGLAETPVACVVEGTATTCRSFRPASGKRVGGDLVRVVLRGRTVVVACATLDPVVTRPKACDGLLSVRQASGAP